jgi:hypothetical protein
MITGKIPSNAADTETFRLPLIGEIFPGTISVFVMTMAIALVDGFNPCSLWVLTMLLGLIVHTKSRRKVMLVGIVFLFVTAGVYGLFIIGLLNLFHITGVSAPLRMIVAAIAIAMGTINIKDYIVFKRGISLTIPSRFQRSIGRGSRKVVSAVASPMGTIGVTAFFAAAVSVVELPCTAGFPVIWSNYVVILVGRESVSFWLLLVLYLLVYLLIEVIIVIIAAVTLGRIQFGERYVRPVKLLGGAIMVSIGMHFISDSQILYTLSGIARVFLFAFVGAAVIAMSYIIVWRAFQNKGD